MKKTAFKFLIVVLLPVISLAQQKPKIPAKKPATGVSNKASVNPNFGNLKPQDYKYYFLGTPGKYYFEYRHPENVSYLPVIDIRTLKPINVFFFNKLVKSKLMPDSTILQYSSRPGESYVIRLSSTGQLIYSVKTELSMSNDVFYVLLSPDAKYGIFFKNKDIWTVDFDYKSGKLSNPHQVTQLGIFNLEDPWNWYAKTLGISNYLVNLTNGTVVDLSEKFEFNISDYNKGAFYDMKYVSPGNRWAKLEGKREGKATIHLFDFLNFELKETKIANEKTSLIWWVSENEFMFNFLQHNQITNYDETLFANIIDARTREGKIVANAKEMMAQGNSHPKYKHINSPNNKHIIYYNLTSNNNHDEINVYNTIDQSKKKLNFTWPAQGNVYLQNSLYWVDDDHIMFSQYEGYVNITAKGAYICNLLTGEIKKLTSYTLNDNQRDSPVVGLPEIDMVIFNANGYLFKSKIDGTQVEQITKEPNEMKVHAKFSDFEKIN